MFCVNCGKKLDDEVKFCSECGQKVGGTTSIQEVAQKPTLPIIERKINGTTVDVFKILYENDVLVEDKEVLRRKKVMEALMAAGVKSSRSAIDAVLNDSEARDAVILAKQASSDSRYRDDNAHCPKCNSAQITYNKKGFSLLKGLGGVILTGGIGVFAGLHGKNKVYATCVKCGHKWNV